MNILSITKIDIVFLRFLNVIPNPEKVLGKSAGINHWLN
jgi:hypothetical protein